MFQWYLISHNQVLLSHLDVSCPNTFSTMCALAYSDLSYDTVQSLASRVNAAGCKFVQLPPKLTQLQSTKPVIAICATRTGTGKSQTTRFVADYLKKKGNTIAVVRHPMPYDAVLMNQRCQRYEVLEDLVKYKCTIEEREVGGLLSFLTSRWRTTIPQSFYNNRNMNFTSKREICFSPG